jgi:serine/threonine-protein kinase
MDTPAPARLTILRKIASGGMGDVYHAVQRGAEGFLKTVAIKTIKSKYASRDQFINMFIGEAKLVADLVHQNIAQVYDLREKDGQLYIVMEYVEGVNLSEFIEAHREQERRIPIMIGSFIVSRIARGLEYAHKKTGPDGAPLGIVHRDISTRNVMLTTLGEVKILDFGVAKAAHLALGDEQGQVYGKYNYMAPEQARGEPTDYRSDLYSLGIVLWETLAARNPFHDSPDFNEHMRRVSVGEVPPLEQHVEDVPDMLLDIVRRSLQPDPAVRYQDAGNMGYDLEYFMYHKGYGPTIVTLERYLRELFADRPGFREGERPESLEQLPETLVLEKPDDDASPQDT